VRNELARSDRLVKTPRSVGNLASSTELAFPSAILPVRVAPNDLEPPAGTAPIETLLSGPTLRVHRGFAPHTLDAALAVP
jgi:hypothetical protein